MLATRYHLPPPQVTADNNDQPQLVDAEEVKWTQATNGRRKKTKIWNDGLPMLDDLVLHQWWLWIITMTIFITKIIIIMIKMFQWQALHTKIKLLSFLLRSSRRTLIFSQASPIKVKINMYCTLLPCMVSINGFHGLTRIFLLERNTLQQKNPHILPSLSHKG